MALEKRVRVRGAAFIEEPVLHTEQDDLLLITTGVNAAIFILLLRGLGDEGRIPREWARGWDY